MPEFIPILVMVDGKTILDAFGPGGTRQRPISLLSQEHKCLYMIGHHSYALSLPYWSEIFILAAPGDFLQWRIAAIDRGNHSPIITSFDFLGHKTLQKPSQAIVTEPFFIPAQPSDPNSQVMEVVREDVELTSEVCRSHGFVVSRMVFKLLDEAGAELGYYSWDPIIQICKRE